MKKNPAMKQVEKAWAAQAAAVPRGPIDPERLAAQVEAHKAKVAARESRARELVAALPAPKEAREITEVMPDVLAAMSRLRATARVSSADELRAAVLRDEVLPRLANWGFELRFRREITSWGCVPQEKIFRIVKGKLRGVGAIVALIGKRGTGKTTLAAQLALDRVWQEQAIREAGKPGYIVTCSYRKVTSLVRRFKALYANFGATNMEELTFALNWLCSRETDLLFIDEMHDLGELAVREAMLIDIIDRRYAARMDTVLISNQTPEEWEDQTPLSIQSRIAEHGAVLKCEWESWREKR